MSEAPGNNTPGRTIVSACRYGPTGQSVSGRPGGLGPVPKCPAWPPADPSAFPGARWAAARPLACDFGSGHSGRSTFCGAGAENIVQCPQSCAEPSAIITAAKRSPWFFPSSRHHSHREGARPPGSNRRRSDLFTVWYGSIGRPSRRPMAINQPPQANEVGNHWHDPDAAHRSLSWDS